MEESPLERPAAERPSGERPSAERLSAERPSAERPSAERPSAERPSAERPSAERPSAERLSAERPSAERPSLLPRLRELVMQATAKKKSPPPPPPARASAPPHPRASAPPPARASAPPPATNATRPAARSPAPGTGPHGRPPTSATPARARSPINPPAREPSPAASEQGSSGDPVESPRGYASASGSEYESDYGSVSGSASASWSTECSEGDEWSDEASTDDSRERIENWENAAHRQGVARTRQARGGRQQRRQRMVWTDVLTVDLVRTVIDALARHGRPPYAPIHCWWEILDAWDERHGGLGLTVAQLQRRIRVVTLWVSHIRHMQSFFPPGVTWNPEREYFRPDPKLGVLERVKRLPQWSSMRRWQAHKAPWFPLAQQLVFHSNQRGLYAMASNEPFTDRFLWDDPGGGRGGGLRRRPRPAAVAPAATAAAAAAAASRGAEGDGEGSGGGRQGARRRQVASPLNEPVKRRRVQSSSAGDRKTGMARALEREITITYRRIGDRIVVLADEYDEYLPAAEKAVVEIEGLSTREKEAAVRGFQKTPHMARLFPSFSVEMQMEYARRCYRDEQAAIAKYCGRQFTDEGARDSGFCK
ncbi:hypothetical protein CLOP_g25600 [Closterium sp. NIES-67]|nr:hypothetical protein CLOP_g25600 [Closterium sp. NIES-67]